MLVVHAQRRLQAKTGGGHSVLWICRWGEQRMSISKKPPRVEVECVTV